MIDVKGLQKNYGGLQVLKGVDLTINKGDCVVLVGPSGCGKSTLLNLLSGFERPYFLAGGLNPGNVVKAVKQLHPYGIDLSSGIETDGVKDKGKLSSVIASVRRMK